jgi:uncharacterized RDD family membrane protein YckC
MTAALNSAPFIRRWIATTIDFICCALILLGWGFMFKLGSLVLTGQSIERLLDYSGSEGGYSDSTLFFAFFPSAVTLWYYHARMESSLKMATLGKRIAGLRVVTKSGQKISALQATWRFCSKLFLLLLSIFILGPLVGLGEYIPKELLPVYVIAAAMLYMSFFPAAFTRKKRPMQDFLSGSLVVLKN